MVRQSGNRNRKRLGSLLTILALLSVVPTPIASADPRWDQGRPFDPQPASGSLYAVSATTDKRLVRSFDGTKLFLETWLPIAKDGGPPPPTRVPTVLVMTPYSMEGKIYESYVAARDVLVTRGYAFSVMHTRGTGSSEGCLTLLGPEEAADGAEVIEYIGTEAPWADGNVGTFGSSYVGATQIATATGGDPHKLRFLRAMVVGNPAASWYDHLTHDGVPSWIEGPAKAFYYLEKSFFPYSGVGDLLSGPQEVEYSLNARLSPGGIPARQAPGKIHCQPENLAAGADKSGDVTPWFAARDWRQGADKIEAATLMFHGALDRTVPTIVQAGLFDRIQAPKAGVFGDFGHPAGLESVEREESVVFGSECRLPDESGLCLKPGPGIRPDWWEMVVAWYDHHLKGIDTGTASWPVAQVESNDGVWRAEPNWPATGGPAGHLVLGPGTLGVEPAPEPSSTYTEAVVQTDRSWADRTEGSFVSFDSGPLEDRLEITGMPVLDLWVQLDKPDAHIAAEIETFDAEGNPIESRTRSGSTVGFRSMRHLEPFMNGRFVQSQGQDAPINEPIHTVVRFRPVDLVVPPGGRVVLTIAGTQRWSTVGLPTEHPNWPSLANATVTILHDCEHMSALRFVMPRERMDVLDVATPDDPDVGDTGVFSRGNAWGHQPKIDSDGGIATEPVCGQEPIRFDEFFGSEIE